MRPGVSKFKIQAENIHMAEEEFTRFCLNQMCKISMGKTFYSVAGTDFIPSSWTAAIPWTQKNEDDFKKIFVKVYKVFFNNKFNPYEEYEFFRNRFRITTLSARSRRRHS